jgi:hypothetical protein
MTPATATIYDYPNGVQHRMSTTYTTVTVGLSESDRDDNYFPMMDGYRPGVAQQTVSIAVEDALLLAPEAMAEAVFHASNAPTIDPANPLHRTLRAGLRGYRSVSVGDTVTIGEVRLACERTGWSVAR